MLVDLTSPGITIRPIVDLAGERHFSEVVFQDVHVPRSALVGDMGNGWPQVMSELAYERSRQLMDTSPANTDFARLLAYTVASAPAFSLRGGAGQILRGIIARGLGLR